jgi:hypothetical protein
MSTKPSVNGTSELAWFKSSYSDNEGGACLEVALDWRKSTYSSDQGGNCVEVADCPDTVHIRDSKNIAGPQLAFPAPQWAEFIAYATR